MKCNLQPRFFTKKKRAASTAARTGRMRWRRARFLRRAAGLLRGRAVQHVVLRDRGDRHDFVNQLLLHLQLDERLLQVLGHRVEVRLVQLQLRVRLAHVLTVPRHRPAQRRGEKRLLLHALAHTSNGLGRAGKLEVMQFNFVTKFARPLKKPNVGLATQRAFECKGFAPPQAILNLCKQQARSLHCAGAGFQRGNPACNFVSVQEAQAFNFLW